MSTQSAGLGSVFLEQTEEPGEGWVTLYSNRINLLAGVSLPGRLYFISPHRYTVHLKQEPENAVLARFFFDCVFTDAIADILYTRSYWDNVRVRITPSETAFASFLQIRYWISKAYLDRITEAPKVPKIFKLVALKNIVLSPVRIISAPALGCVAAEQPIRPLYKHQIDNLWWLRRTEDRVRSRDTGFDMLRDRFHYRFVLNGRELYYRDGVVRSKDQLLVDRVHCRGGMLLDPVGMGKSACFAALMSGGAGLSLVLCPRRIGGQWVREIKQTTGESARLIMSIVQYMKFCNGDYTERIYVMSFSFLTNKKYHTNPDISRINDHSWKRVIVDEAHEIFLPEARQKSVRTMFKELVGLRGATKWVCTATPLLNGEAGMLSMVAWLVDRSVRATGQYGSSVALFVESYSRRTCEDELRELASQIPTPRYSSVFLEQTETERAMYRSVHEDPEKMIQICSHPIICYSALFNNKLMTMGELRKKLLEHSQKNIPRLQTRLSNIQQSLNGLRMMAHDKNPVEGLLQDTESAVAKHKSCKREIGALEMRQRLLDEITMEIDKKEDSCCVCMERFESFVLTPCNHTVCCGCLDIMFRNRSTVPCPLCRAPLRTAQLERCTLSAQPNQLRNYGTKAERLVEMLRAITALPNTRTIVFSRWNRMLLLLGKALLESGIAHTTIKGNPFSVEARITKFKTSDDCRVALLSSDICASGLCLTEATHLILYDAFHSDVNTAKQIEQQVLGRVLRLGQTKRVDIYRLVMKNTIEEDLLTRFLESA